MGSIESWSGLFWKIIRKVLHNYSNSLNLYNVAERSSNTTVGNGVLVETGNEKFTFPAHILHKTFKLVISCCCCLAVYSEEMYQNEGLCFLMKSYLFSDVLTVGTIDSRLLTSLIAGYQLLMTALLDSKPLIFLNRYFLGRLLV